MVPVGGLLLFIAMYTLSSTADIYLTPALETITVTFKLSDSLAGVTLLALGNGAPDVFSGIAAANEKTIDAAKSICVLLGGTTFITSVVVAMSTFAANENPDPHGPKQRRIKVTPRFFIRDISFLLAAVIYILIVMLGVKFINLPIAIGFLLIYVLYVVLVVVQSRRAKNEEEELQDANANKFNEIITLQRIHSKRPIDFQQIDEIAEVVLTKGKDLDNHLQLKKGVTRSMSHNIENEEGAEEKLLAKKHTILYDNPERKSLEVPKSNANKSQKGTIVETDDNSIQVKDLDES